MTSGISSASSAVAAISADGDSPEHAAGKSRRRHRAAGLAHPQPCRHQRRVQPALGQQPPHHVDQLKRRQERIRHRARAKQRGDSAESRTKPSSREASVPEDTVRKERIIAASIAAASLAGAGPIW